MTSSVLPIRAFLPLPVAALELGKTPKEVFRLVAEGPLNGYRIGGELCVASDELEAFRARAS